MFLLDFKIRVYVLLQNRFRVLVNMNGFWFRVRVLIKKPFFKRKHHSMFENFKLVFHIHVRVYCLYVKLCAKAYVVLLFRVLTVRR